MDRFRRQRKRHPPDPFFRVPFPKGIGLGLQVVWDRPFPEYRTIRGFEHRVVPGGSTGKEKADRRAVRRPCRIPFQHEPAVPRQNPPEAHPQTAEIPFHPFEVFPSLRDGIAVIALVQAEQIRRIPQQQQVMPVEHRGAGLLIGALRELPLDRAGEASHPFGRGQQGVNRPAAVGPDQAIAAQRNRFRPVTADRAAEFFHREGRRLSRRYPAGCVGGGMELPLLEYRQEIPLHRQRGHRLRGVSHRHIAVFRKVERVAGGAPLHPVGVPRVPRQEQPCPAR